MSDLLPGRTFDAVLFDMDGTLVDSTESVRRSWLEWAGEHGVQPAALLGNHGVPARQIVEVVLPGVVTLDRVEAALARIEAIEIADVDGILVLPGAREALSALPAGRAAIVTSCTEPLAKARLDAAALLPPDVVVTASDVTRGKPDPEPYLLGARRLGLAPERCLVVEDAPAGLVSARAAGCATLAVATTHRADELEADVVVPTLAAVAFEVDDDGVRVVAGR